MPGPSSSEAPPPPARPRVLNVKLHSIELEWTHPDGLLPASYKVLCRVGGSGIFFEIIEDTKTDDTKALLVGLESSTWYEFRVAAISADGTVGPGSPPTEPVSTLQEAMRPEEPSAEAEDTPRAALRSLKDDGPALARPEADLLALEATLRLEDSRLHLSILKWDDEFLTAHGRSVRDQERVEHPARLELLRRLHAARRELRELEANPALAVARLDRVHAEADVAAEPAPRALYNETRQLSATLESEARLLYEQLLTRRCASLAKKDGLSALS
jgi:hypothetical protein